MLDKIDKVIEEALADACLNGIEVCIAHAKNSETLEEVRMRLNRVKDIYLKRFPSEPQQKGDPRC